MILTNKQKQEAGKAICNCRELCGDEQQAFSEWCSDNNIKPNSAIKAQAFAASWNIWNGYRRQAGIRAF